MQVTIARLGQLEAGEHGLRRAHHVVAATAEVSGKLYGPENRSSLTTGSSFSVCIKTRSNESAAANTTLNLLLFNFNQLRASQ